MNSAALASFHSAAELPDPPTEYDRIERDVATRVAAGAVWMDEHDPGWAEKIDTERFNLSSCQDCVIGQRFGWYGDVVRPLSARPEEWPGRLLGSEEARALGFDRNFGETYQRLERAWRREIDARRGEP